MLPTRPKRIGWTKFSGPTREPVFLPNGTAVIPLAWSPTDTQLAEARHMSLLDVANMFNLDGYWLGAPVAGHDVPHGRAAVPTNFAYLA